MNISSNLKYVPIDDTHVDKYHKIIQFCKFSTKLKNEYEYEIIPVDMNLHGHFDVFEKKSIDFHWRDYFSLDNLLKIKDIFTFHYIDQYIVDYNENNGSLSWFFYKNPNTFSFAEILMQIPLDIIDRVNAVAVEPVYYHDSLSKSYKEQGAFLLRASLMSEYNA